MTLNLPLAVRLRTAKGDKHVTPDLHDLTFRSTVPGGYASATLTLSRPLAIQPEEIAEFGSVFIYDRRDGSTVWEGRLEDPGRAAGDAGEVWAITATGPAAYAQDRTVPLMYVDRRLDAWAVGIDTTSSVTISTTDGDSILMQVAAGSTFVQNTSGLIVYHGIAYTGQALGRISIPWTSGVGSSNILFRVGTAIDSNATVDLDSDTASVGSGSLEGSLGGSNNIGTDHNSVRLRITRVNGSGDLAVTNDTVWVSYNVPRIRAVIKDSSGNDITTGYNLDTLLASDVVTDLLGRLLDRYDGPNAYIETTSFDIDQFAYPDGANAQKILEDLMLIEPAYYWAAWESGSNGLHRFEWRTWPTAVRYEASTADGFDSPASGSELYNAVSVRWRSGFGVSRTNRSTQTVGILDAAGLTREAYIDLADEMGSDALASKVGAEFLAEHQTPVNHGTLTISRPILDIDRGRVVMPWEIKPGTLIRVRDVLPRIDALNATARDGVTVFKIAAVEFNAATATATLDLDAYTLTMARAIADLSKRHITRKR